MKSCERRSGVCEFVMDNVFFKNTKFTKRLQFLSIILDKTEYKTRYSKGHMLFKT